MVTAPDIPGHRVGGVLGAGGFATVYRAWQLAVGREVAVKVDNRALLTERDRRRFFREVTAAGRLSGHPHVIDVYDAGTLDDGRPYLVMELCPAGSLNDALARDGPMSAGQVRDIGIKIADGLAAAHVAGVLHRDIKPANILLNRYGMVGLSDFGLASIIAAGGEQSASLDALTPAFSAPESFRGEQPTAVADVYPSRARCTRCWRAGRHASRPTGKRRAWPRSCHCTTSRCRTFLACRPSSWRRCAGAFRPTRPRARKPRPRSATRSSASTPGRPRTSRHPRTLGWPSTPGWPGTPGRAATRLGFPPGRTRPADQPTGQVPARCSLAAARCSPAAARLGDVRDRHHAHGCANL